MTTVTTPGVTEPALAAQIGLRTSPAVWVVHVHLARRTRWNCAWVAMAMPASMGDGTTVADRMQRATITIRPPRSNKHFSARATCGRVPAVAGTKSAYKFPKPQSFGLCATRTPLTESSTVAPYLRMHSRWVKAPYSLQGGVQVADVLEL